MGRAASGGEFWGVCELSMTFCKASILQLKKGKKSPEPGVWNNHSRDILNIFQTFKNVFMNVLHLCGSLCCCSVTQSCLTLWDPMDCSTPGFPVLDYVPEFAQIHVHWVDDAIQPSHPLLSPSSPAFNLSQLRIFSNVSVLHIRWSKYWRFSFSINPSNEYSGLISFKMDWLDLFAVQGTLTSLL